MLIRRTTPAPTHLSVSEMDDTDCETVTAPGTSQPRRKEHTERKDTVTDVDCESTWYNTDHDGGSAREKWNTGEYYKNSVAKNWSGWEGDCPGHPTPASSGSTFAYMEASTGKKNMNSGCYRLSGWDSTHDDLRGYEHVSTESQDLALEALEW